MSKIKGKNGNAKLQSADKTKDREFEQWVQQQFMAEAAAIEKEIDGIHDSKEFEPTEEKFQKLLQKAREQGSVYSEPDSAQTKVSEDSTTVNTGVITSEKIKSGKLNNEKLNMEPKKTKHTHIGKGKFAGVGEKVVKWAAVAAVTVFGIFGVSMTSEANRAYVMEKIDIMTGDDVGTRIDNDKTLGQEKSEEEAKIDIEKTFSIELPEFFYYPEQMYFDTYGIDSEAKMGFLQYEFEGKLVVLTVYVNEKNASAFALSDAGQLIDNITSQIFSPIKTTLWEVQEDDDRAPTYILQWDYKNVYYELTGKISEDIMRKIAENIIF